jgi:hypothetical protein
MLVRSFAHAINMAEELEAKLSGFAILPKKKMSSGLSIDESSGYTADMDAKAVVADIANKAWASQHLSDLQSESQPSVDWKQDSNIHQSSQTGSLVSDGRIALFSISPPPFIQRPPTLHNAVGRITTATHYFSPVILFFVFLTAFVYRGVRLASSKEPEDLANGATGQLYGPGGKPLPIRKVTGLKRKLDKAKDFSPAKKTLFRVISLLATLSFLGSAGLVCAHLLAEGGWWCGEAQVVSVDSRLYNICLRHELT